MGRIIIYTTTGCPFSLKVKNIFEKKNVQFTEINLTEFPTVVDELADWAKGKRSIPQVFFEDEFIGGLDELLTMQNNGRLDDLLKKLQDTPNGHNRAVPKSRRKTLAPWKNLKLDPVLEDVFKRLRDKEKGLELKNRFQNSHTFKGSALIKWLTVNNKSTEDEALRMAEKLRTKGYFYRIKEDKPIANDSSLFRFYADDYPDVLNGRIVYTGDSRSALDIALYLQDTINTIYEGHTNLDDGNVDYEKIKKLKEYIAFCDNTIELHKVDIAGLKTKESILFYLAMYKVLLLHGEIALGFKPKSKADKARLYSQYSYNIAGQNYTLESIEAILRGKPKGSSGSDQIRKMLSRKEMAKAAGLSKADPRIHFAMISCDKFSQPIRFLDSKNMDSALQWATELFCADIEVSFRTKSVNLPLLFKEYRADFGKTNKELLSWVVMFLPDNKEEKVRQLLATVPEEAITINFKKRGWEVDRIFGDLEDNDEEEVKINQRTTGDSDDLNGAKDNQEPVDEDDDAYFNYEPVSKELLDKFNEVFSTNSTTLELKDSGLKYLPKELGKGKKMDACKKVVITDNQLTMLPRWFAVTFTNLTILYINGNKLRTVPANLADIKQLETVDLSNNLISLIPNRFCTLRNLRALNLSGNNLEFLPVGFAQLRQLEELLLAHNQLAELRDNFGELSKLEILDISHNRLTVLPDSVANFKRLEEFNLRGNRLKELPLTIEQLSSLVLLDLSHNDLKELPSELGGMANLTELYLASNKIKKLSKGFCDLNCSIVDLEENPLVEPPKEVCNEGMEAIRKHFNWTKPSARNAPRSRNSSANLQAELDRSQSASSLTGAINDGTTPRDLKRLSTNEKRALLIKRVVVKKFDPTKLNEIRATVQNQDITTVLAAAAAAEEERRKERQAQNLDSSDDPLRQSPPKEDQLGRQSIEVEIPALNIDKITSSGTSPNLTRRIAQLIAPAGGFRIDRNEGKLPDIEDLALQEFNFIFDYGNDFFGKPHHNFIGISKEYGAILISILREGDEDEPEEKERKLFGTLKFKRKAKSPSVPNFFSRVQSKDKMMKKKPSSGNLKADAIDSPAASMESPSLQKRSSQANLASALSTTSMHKDSARSEHKDSARSERLDTPKEEKTQSSPRKPETPKEDKPMPSPRSIRHNSSNSSMTAATNSHDEDSETHETSEDAPTPRDEKDGKEGKDKDKSEKDKDKSGRPSLHRSRSRSIEPGNSGKLMKSKSRDLKREKEKVMLKRQMMLSSVKEERKNVTMSGDFDLSSTSKKQSKRNSAELKDPKDSPSSVRFSGKESSSNTEHQRDVTPPKITKKGSRLTMTTSEKKDKEKDKESKDKDKEKDKERDKDRDRDSRNSEDKKIDEKDEESAEQGKNMTKTRSSRQLGISAIGARRKTSTANELAVEKQKSESITPRSGAAAESSTPSALNLLIRVRKSDRRLKMSLKNFQSTGSRASRMKPKQMIKMLKDEYPEYSGITFKQIKNEDMEQELLNMELRLMVKGYKYGILYAKEGQVEEEKMFCNNDPSPDFTEFLEFLADKIELKGWEAYNGGLDVQQGMTGKHSYFTKFKDYSIMFHVSTELPFTEGDPQQIERKRHLGNDIVVIVFQEGDTPFNPTCVHSYFNHVFFVVRKELNSEGKTMYRVSVTSKSGVAPHLPVLPDPPVFEKGPHFREFFFTKLINCERASYSAPGFAYAIENTRGQLIQQIVDNYYFD